MIVQSMNANTLPMGSTNAAARTGTTPTEEQSESPAERVRETQVSSAAQGGLQNLQDWQGSKINIMA